MDTDSPGPADTPPDLLTVPEVAQRLRVDNSTVYRLCADKKLPHLRYTDGGKVLIRRIDLDAWLAARTIPAV